MFCKKCGNEIQTGQKFCIRCGTLVSTDVKETVKPQKKETQVKEKVAKEQNTVKKTKMPKIPKEPKKPQNKGKLALMIVVALILVGIISLTVVVIIKSIGIGNEYQSSVAKITKLDLKSDTLKQELVNLQEKWKKTTIIDFGKKSEVIEEIDSLYDKYEKADRALAEYQVQLEECENSKEIYDLNGKVDSYKEYVKIMETCQKDIQERNYDATEADMSKLMNSKDKVVKDNNKYIDKKVNKFKSSGFYSDSRLSDIVDDINSLKDEEVYNQIAEKISEASETVSELKAEEYAIQQEQEEEDRAAINDLVFSYLHDFVEAMWYNDFSMISSYLWENSSIYNYQLDYVSNGWSKFGVYDEDFIDATIKSINFSDSSKAVIKTKEKYRVEKTDNSSKYVTQDVRYEAIKEYGRWYLTEIKLL